MKLTQTFIKNEKADVQSGKFTNFTRTIVAFINSDGQFEQYTVPISFRKITVDMPRYRTHRYVWNGIR